MKLNWIGYVKLNMILLVTIFLVLLLVLFWQYGRKDRYLPPGPKPYPFVGCLPQLISSGKPVPEMIRNHRKLYGDISAFPLVRINLGD